MFKSEIEETAVMLCMCAWAAGMWFLWVVKNLMTVQSQHVPPGGQPLQRHMLTVHCQKTPFKKGFWYSLYKWDLLHMAMHHHMYIHTSEGTFTYIRTPPAYWNLLNPELNVPSPTDAISSRSRSFYHTTQENNRTGTISPTHWEALSLPLWHLFRVEERKWFTVTTMTQMCKMSEMLEHVCVLKHYISVQNINRIYLHAWL